LVEEDEPHFALSPRRVVNIANINERSRLSPDPTDDSDEEEQVGQLEDDNWPWAAKVTSSNGHMKPP